MDNNETTAPNYYAWVAQTNRSHRNRTISLIAEWHEAGLSAKRYSEMLRGARRFGLDIMAVI